MAYYRISPSRVRRIIKSPERIEEGIAPNTVAFMQPVSYKTKNGIRSWNNEYWVMVVTRNTTNDRQQTTNNKGLKTLNGRKPLVVGSQLKIISAWRYPGMTKPGASLPQEILNEVSEALRSL